MGGWVDGWINGFMMGQWVGSCQITKNQINFEVIEIIQIWTFLTFLLKPPQPLMGLFLRVSLSETHFEKTGMV